MAQDYQSELSSLLLEMEKCPKDRHLLQPKFHKLLINMRAAKIAVPPSMDGLNRRLVDEGVEALFDNMPV